MSGFFVIINAIKKFKKLLVFIDLIETNPNYRVASFLKNNFSELGAETSNQMASELDKLRRTACVKALDKNETSLAVLTKYHDQLVKIQGKIPFSMKDCAVTFAWKDPFEKRGGLLGGSGYG